MSHDYRVTAHLGSTGYRIDITAAQHQLIADEPIKDGGTDQGPTPYDLLIAALGACTAMTLRMYAERKSWPLTGVIVRLRHGRSYGEDDRKCETAPVRIDQIDREIELHGDLNDEQRERLLEIADRCPVHRTLDAGVKIKTMLAVT
jgi:putative redox protein